MHAVSHVGYGDTYACLQTALLCGHDTSQAQATLTAGNHACTLHACARQEQAGTP